MKAHTLRRLTAVVIVAGLASPVAAAPAGEKAGTNTTSAADSAALGAAMLAVRERLMALKKKSKQTAMNVPSTAEVPAGISQVAEAALREQQAQIDELRAEMKALRATAAARIATVQSHPAADAAATTATTAQGTQPARVAQAEAGAPAPGEAEVPTTPGAQGDASTGQPQENMVGTKSAPTDASVQSVYQQQNALFVRKLTVTPSITHAYSDNRFFTLNGFLALGTVFLGNVNVTQQRSDITQLGLDTTYGLSDRAQLEAQVPYYNRSTTFASVGANDSTQLPSEDRVHSSGLGDVVLGAFYQVKRESGSTPGITVNGHVSLPTGRSPYGIKLVTDASNSSLQYPGSLPTGSGALGYEVGASFVKTSDPAIFFGGANFYYNTATHVADLSTSPLLHQPGIAQPGSAFQYQLGTAFALNERTSLSFAFDDIITNDTRLTPEGGKVQNVVGSATNAAYLSISAGYARDPRQTVVTEFDLGLTQDAPNFQLNIRLPHRF